MTQDQDLLRPLEPAQRLASADRETLETIQAAVGECTSLIAAQGAALQQTADQQLEALQACADVVGHLAERIDRQGDGGAALHAELTEAMRQVPVAIAGLPERLDAAGAESTAGVRAALAALNGTLDKVAETLSSHDRRLVAVTDAVSVLSATVEALREEAHGGRARHAQTSQTRTLGNLVKGTASLGARFGFFEAALERHKTDFWLHAVAIPLLIGCAFFFGMMTDFVIQFLDAPARTSALLELPLPPWPPDNGIHLGEPFPDYPGFSARR